MSSTIQGLILSCATCVIYVVRACSISPVHHVFVCFSTLTLHIEEWQTQQSYVSHVYAVALLQIIHHMLVNSCESGCTDPRRLWSPLPTARADCEDLVRFGRYLQRVSP